MSTTRSLRRQLAVGISLLIGVLALAYLARFAVLTLDATEGDAPPVSSMALPEGTTVVSTDKQCGSGGCWSVFTIQPEPESTPQQFSIHLEETFAGHISGSFFDPRTVNFKTEIRGSVAVITASYWTKYDA